MGRSIIFNLLPVSPFFLAGWFFGFFPFFYFSDFTGSAYAFEGRWIGGKVVEKIEWESPIPLPMEKIEAGALIQEGDKVDFDKIRRSLSVLYQTGKFRNIWVEAKAGQAGILLVFHLTPSFFLGKIVVKGNENVSDGKIKDVLDIQKGDEWFSDFNFAMEEKIKAFYRKEGFFNVSVLIEETVPVSEQEVALHISVREGSPAKLSRLELLGELVFPRKKILRQFDTEVGERYRASQLEEDLIRLEDWYVKQGYIQTSIPAPRVIYQKESNRVEIEVLIKPGVKVNVLFEGNEAFSNKRLKNETLLESERSFEPGVLRDSAERIKDAYRKEGYPFSNVSFEVQELSTGEVEVRFIVSEGQRALIEEISIEGNRHLSTGKIKGVMETEPAGIFFGGVFIRETVEEDMKAIRQIYEEEGFLQAQATWKLEESQDRTELFLKIRIEEGVRTFVHRIHFVGNEDIKTQTLKGISTLKKGEPFNPKKLKEDLRKILSHYSQLGYIYAKVDQETNFRDDRRQVEILYRISEDQPAVVGEIQIRGNSYTKDHVIRRELLVGPGDPYNYEKILRSTQRLYRLGFFRDVQFEPDQPEEKYYVRDMVLTVKEKNTGALDFGGGYGEEEGVKGFVEISQNNINGTGRRAALRAEGSLNEAKYTINFKEPWLFDYNIDARFGLIYLIQERTSYKLTTYGATVGIERSFSETIKGSITYQFERNTTDVDSPQLIEEDLRRINIGSINPSLIRDSRDDPFNPKTGSINGILIRDAAQILGSEVQFIKATVQSSWYFRLSPWAVFALSGRGGYATEFGESLEVPITDRYFLGGRSTVRGYKQDSLGPRTPDGTLTGGNAMLNFNYEIRFTLPFNLGLVVFVDSGNVWKEPNEVGLGDLKYSVGSGIRYNTPVGPLRLDYGYKLEREPGEDTYEIHFTLGQAF